MLYLLIFLPFICPVFVYGESKSALFTSPKNPVVKKEAMPVFLKLPGSHRKDSRAGRNDETGRARLIKPENLVPGKTGVKHDRYKPKKKNERLTVKTVYNRFDLVYSKRKISIKDPGSDLTLHRKKCNSHILDSFYYELRSLINTLKTEAEETEKNLKPDIISVLIESEEYFVKFASPAGQSFLSLPLEFARMKKEEKLNCDS